MKKSKKKVVKKTEPVEIETIEFDPRRQKFASFYIDPNSTTYANALQSALRAGYARGYAESILSFKPRWLLEILGKENRISKALKNLDEDLGINPLVQAMGAFGPITDKKTKKPIMVLNNKLIERRQDATFFVLEKTHPEFKKREKSDSELDPLKVEIKQIIIIAPNGQSIPYNQTNTKAISGVPKTT